MRQLRIIMIGFGGVGRALAQMLAAKRSVLRSEYGFEPVIIGVSDLFLGSAHSETGLDIDKLLSVPKEKGAFSTLMGGSPDPDNERLLSQSDADILVEASFTNPEDGEPALGFCRRAAEKGMHVVTTNKGPAAFGLDEISEISIRNGGSFFYEGAVMSGTPVLSFARECLPATRVTGFRGILNGTANYILGRMEDEVELALAIKEAQLRGYAESDPTADIEGFDVMMKVIILSRVLFGKSLSPQDIDRTGITGITASMIKEATAQGKRWKLVGSGEISDDGYFVATVKPRCIEASDLLYGVNGAINAITYQTEDLGDVLISGPGAGLQETAYALLADIIFVMKNKR